MRISSNYITNLKIIIHADYLWQAAFVFAIIAAGVMLFIIFYLNVFSKQKRRREHLRSIYSSLLSEIILCDTKEELLECMKTPYIQSIQKRWLYNEKARSLLIQEMVQVTKSLSGVAHNNILWLYTHLELQKDSLAYLQSRKWHIKVRSIQELAEMRQIDIITRIYRETNSRNKYIRAEAQIAVVKLTGFDGLRFLGVLSQPLSVWQQICLLEQLPPFGIDGKKVSKWLQSTNESVIEFALRLIHRYQLFDQLEAAIPFLGHLSRNIRLQAIHSLFELDLEGAVELVRDKLSSASFYLKESFLQLVTAMDQSESIPLLQLLTKDPEEKISCQAQQLIKRSKNALEAKTTGRLANGS